MAPSARVLRQPLERAASRLEASTIEECGRHLDQESYQYRQAFRCLPRAIG